MDRTEEHPDRRIEQETAALDLEGRGEAVITVAKALLGMEFILICFVLVGLRTGSHLFLWWVIAEGVLGLILLAIGVHQKSHARGKLSALEPR